MFVTFLLSYYFSSGHPFGQRMINVGIGTLHAGGVGDGVGTPCVGEGEGDGVGVGVDVGVGVLQMPGSVMVICFVHTVAVSVQVKDTSYVPAVPYANVCSLRRVTSWSRVPKLKLPSDQSERVNILPDPSVVTEKSQRFVEEHPACESTVSCSPPPGHEVGVGISGIVVGVGVDPTGCVGVRGIQQNPSTGFVGVGDD